MGVSLRRLFGYGFDAGLLLDLVTIFAVAAIGRRVGSAVEPMQVRSDNILYYANVPPASGEIDNAHVGGCECGVEDVCSCSDSLLAIRFETAERKYSTRGTHILYTDRTHPWGVSASAAAEWADNRTNTHLNLISSTYTPPASRIDVFQWPGEMRCTYLHNEKATTGNSAHFSLQGALGENQSDKKCSRIR